MGHDVTTVNKWRAKNREHYNAYMKEYRERKGPRKSKKVRPGTLSEKRASYYQDNKEHIRCQVGAWAAKRRKELHAFRDWLKDQPCMDCGLKFPPVCMDFDHRDPSTKRYSPAIMFTHYTLDAIQTELMKCDLVCANCHRIRTHS